MGRVDAVWLSACRGKMRRLVVQSSLCWSLDASHPSGAPLHTAPGAAATHSAPRTHDCDLPDLLWCSFAQPAPAPPAKVGELPVSFSLSQVTVEEQPAQPKQPAD